MNRRDLLIEVYSQPIMRDLLERGLITKKQLVEFVLMELEEEVPEEETEETADSDVEEVEVEDVDWWKKTFDSATEAAEWAKKNGQEAVAKFNKFKGDLEKWWEDRFGEFKPTPGGYDFTKSKIAIALAMGASKKMALILKKVDNIYDLKKTGDERSLPILSETVIMFEDPEDEKEEEGGRGGSSYEESMQELIVVLNEVEDFLETHLGQLNDDGKWENPELGDESALAFFTKVKNADLDNLKKGLSGKDLPKIREPQKRRDYLRALNKKFGETIKTDKLPDFSEFADEEAQEFLKINEQFTLTPEAMKNISDFITDSNDLKFKLIKTVKKVTGVKPQRIHRMLPTGLPEDFSFSETTTVEDLFDMSPES